MLLASLAVVLTIISPLVSTKSIHFYLTQLISEQAKLRGWSIVIFVGGTTSATKELTQSLSENFIYCGTETDSTLPFDSFGFFCLERSDLAAQPCFVTSYERPWFLITNIARENALKQQLTNSSNVRFDSDIILATYDENTFIDGEIGSNSIELQQVFKIHDTAQLTVKKMGFWTPKASSLKMEPIDSRKGDFKYRAIIGVKNITMPEDDEKESDPNHFLSVLVEKEEDKYVLDLIKSLFLAINISYEIVTYSKKGWKNDEGSWTYMLGALESGHIDIAADIVDMSLDDVHDVVELTNPIIITMSGIYLRKPSGFRARDVFLSTFSKPLQRCFLGTVICFWLAMLTITFFTAPKANIKHDGTDERVWELSEAWLWIVSVTCMQGSPWSPKTTSGCVLLLFSLLFALIIFNSFAAFITSLLSVRDTSIKRVADLVDNGFSSGYIRDSPDELFLRTTEDRDLLALYYRGLVSGGGVADVPEGMLRAVNNYFAFFSSARSARRALRSIVPKRDRCNLIEFGISGTLTPMVIPISKKSVYRKALKFWLLRIRQTGILYRIKNQLHPPMPSCIAGQQFTGASYTDLLMAYYIFFLGLVVSWVLLLGEILWYKRNKLLGSKVSNQPEVFHSQPFDSNIRFRNSGAIWGTFDFVN